MQFHSIEFLIFLPLVVFTYFSIPFRFRWAFLLAASYYFYMCWRPEYVFLIILSTLIDYFAALKMDGLAVGDVKRRKYLVLSVFSNLTILFAFKYFNFFNDSLRALFAETNIFYNVSAFKVLLPIGISFYTFQSLSYTIDVYRGQKKAEKRLGIFALYVAFFPQLVAGPIERSTQLLPQFLKKHNFNYKQATSGLRLMYWGFFKKLVIADRLGLFVDMIYGNPRDHEGVVFIAATVFFAYQIYCDFSGYTDIARGTARIFGIDIMKNFNRPFAATSIRDFWRRWHISLSTWFRDYLYIPLGGNRVSAGRWYYNLLVTFIICGLWHGANWTFVLWGFMHGFFMVFSSMTASIREKFAEVTKLKDHPRVQHAVKVAVTFLLVTYSWILFRANNISDAAYIITHMFSDLNTVLTGLFSLGQGNNILNFGIPTHEILICAGLVVFLEAVQLIQKEVKLEDVLSRQPFMIRWGIYYVAVLAVMYFGTFGRSQFIYFQF